jgi:hypothetical protein
MDNGANRRRYGYSMLSARCIMLSFDMYVAKSSVLGAAARSSTTQQTVPSSRPRKSEVKGVP